MARKLRVEYPGAIYHVTLRGVGRCKIFADDRDRDWFMKRLAEGVELDGVRLYMFCLMMNHAHLLVETPRANLSQFMHRLETGYTIFFNRRHSRKGHLTQGRYDARLVEGDEYLLRLSRYVHLNPVRTTSMKNRPLNERVSVLRKYSWSSYRSYIGNTKELDWVEYGPIREMVAGRKTQKMVRYREFVERGLAGTDEEFMSGFRASPFSIGSEEFMEKVRTIHQDLVAAGRRPEDAAFRRMKPAATADELLPIICGFLGIGKEDLRLQRRDSLTRPFVAMMLCKHGGLTQRQVADVMGLRTGAAVSQQLKRLEEAQRTDRRVRAKIKALDAALQDKLNY